MTQQVVSRRAGGVPINLTGIASTARSRIRANLQGGQITSQQALGLFAEVRKVQFGEEPPSHLEQFGLRDSTSALGQIRARQSEIDRIAQRIQTNDVRAGRVVVPLRTETLATGITLKTRAREIGIEIADALVPGLWARNWNQLSNRERAVNIAFDALFLVPIVGIVGRTALKGSRTIIRRSV
ncbi:hypothetical protein LCGC14_2829190, partial [marine sediment metagenome]